MKNGFVHFSLIITICIPSFLSLSNCNAQNSLFLKKVWTVSEFKENSAEFSLESFAFETYMNSEKGATTYIFNRDSVTVNVENVRVVKNPVIWLTDNSYSFVNDTLSTVFHLEIIDDNSLVQTSDNFSYSQKMIVEKSENK